MRRRRTRRRKQHGRWRAPAFHLYAARRRRFTARGINLEAVDEPIACAPLHRHREPALHQWNDSAPHFGELFAPALEELLGPRRRPDEPLSDRHRDIARSAQPMLLNTSFNENEPVVCEPREALDCFLRTQMDRLVIGNAVLRRTAR